MICLGLTTRISQIYTNTYIKKHPLNCKRGIFFIVGLSRIKILFARREREYIDEMSL
jgi:hypothetical protein